MLGYFWNGYLREEEAEIYLKFFFEPNCVDGDEVIDDLNLF